MRYDVIEVLLYWRGGFELRPELQIGASDERSRGGCFTLVLRNHNGPGFGSKVKHNRCLMPPSPFRATADFSVEAKEGFPGTTIISIECEDSCTERGRGTVKSRLGTLILGRNEH